MSCQNSSFSTVKTAQSASQPTDTTFASCHDTQVKLNMMNMKHEKREPSQSYRLQKLVHQIPKAWARWSWSPSNFPVDVCHVYLSKRKRKTIKRNQKTTFLIKSVCQVFGIAASALYFHLRVPFDAVGIGQNHPPLGVDHEPGPAGTVLPSPLPWQRKVGGAVDAPNLSVPRKFGSRWVDVVPSGKLT